MLDELVHNVRKLVKKLRKTSRSAYQSGWSDTVSLTQVSYGSVINYTTDGIKVDREATDKREVKKPVEVVGGLTVELPEIDLTNLDERIKVVRRRMKVLKEQSVSLTDESEALSYLEARKNYPKYGKLFQWQVTNKEKVQDLLNKYKLRLVSFVAYYKSIPNEALDEIEKFTDAYEHVADGQPYLELIVDEGGPEEKKDPILLARSPFGRWYYILGAWDKEVEYVDDLIYKGK